jgi:GNAT superfamily N-acetyltransferase
MEASDVQIRRAHPDEWATVRDVRLAALADAPDAFASTLSREASRSEPQWRCRIRAWPWFLAWRAGAPAGLVAAVPDQPASGPPAAGRRAWHLVSMWVSPQARGGGVADLLIGAVMAPTGRRQAYPRDGAAPLDEEEFARPVRSAAPPTAPG